MQILSRDQKALMVEVEVLSKLVGILQAIILIKEFQIMEESMLIIYVLLSFKYKVHILLVLCPCRV